MKELWIVDPEPRTVDRFVLDGDDYSTAERFTEADSFTSELLPGLDDRWDEGVRLEA
ncbi:MAG: Uma2 family endonuclease [Verrucomicrobiae bacterium]|nr:Uma2 family endonuclease [Verrucomicrobiae bacterium]